MLMTKTVVLEGRGSLAEFVGHVMRVKMFGVVQYLRSAHTIGAALTNPHNLRLVEKTNVPSTTHKFAKLWRVHCDDCGTEFRCNGCDFHIRRCPKCSGGAVGE